MQNFEIFYVMELENPYEPILDNEQEHNHDELKWSTG